MTRKSGSNQEGSMQSLNGKIGGDTPTQPEETVEKFPTGQILYSQGVRFQIPPEDAICGLVRHVFGDWGELNQAEREENDRALLEGTRLLSRYLSADGQVFWIITEHDRSVTTVFLPIEYGSVLNFLTGFSTH